MQKILNMDQNDCGKRYVCELGVLGVEERESLLQSELALLTILEVSFCMSNARGVMGSGGEGVTPPI
jgi:hypothetical protein